jgi:TDG/mug DNA glycosylase family protein
MVEPLRHHRLARPRSRTVTSQQAGFGSTLDDLLAEHLDVVFVGINPSCFSVQRGHYFARPTNRFWPSLSRSVLSRGARRALGSDKLGPHDDRALLLHGIGFTDLVKRATPKAGDLAPAELAAGVAQLLAKLDRYRPRVACFHGITGYRHVHRLLSGSDTKVDLGPQHIALGPVRLYLVPNPSGVNAHFTPSEQTQWYDRLAEYVAGPHQQSAGPRS